MLLQIPFQQKLLLQTGKSMLALHLLLQLLQTKQNGEAVRHWA